MKLRRSAHTIRLPGFGPPFAVYRRVRPVPIVPIYAWTCVYHSRTEEGDPMVQVVGPSETRLIFPGDW